MSAPIDIIAEHALCEPLLDRHLDALRAEGVPAGALVKNALGGWSMLARDRVAFLGGGRFEFVRYRPAWSACGAYILVGLNEFGEATDLIAWRPPAPPASWLGRVGLLGEEMIAAPRLGEPLRVFESALDWLRAGRDGVVIVDPARAAPLLRQAGPLVVGSVEYGNRLKRLLTVPSPRILVVVPERDRVAA